MWPTWTQFIDIRQAPDVLGDDLIGAVARLDHALAIVIEGVRAVEVGGVGDGLADPPAQPSNRMVLMTEPGSRVPEASRCAFVTSAANKAKPSANPHVGKLARRPRDPRRVMT